MVSRRTVELHVLRRQQKIIGGQQRLLAQPDIFEIGRAHLRVVHGILHRQTNPAPQVRLPGRGSRAMKSSGWFPPPRSFRRRLRDRRGRSDGGIVVGVIGRRLTARACRNCASACFTFWLLTLTNSSSRFSCGSPKISHHLPLIRPSLGVAIFHWSLPGHFFECRRRLRHGPLVSRADRTTRTKRDNKDCDFPSHFSLIRTLCDPAGNQETGTVSDSPAAAG